MSRTTACAVSVSISMLPTLPPISAMAASKRASVPDFCTLRTRTVRMSLRSHAIGYSFPHASDSPVPVKETLLRPTIVLEVAAPLLYSFENGIQLIERLDRDAIGLGENAEWVVEHGQQTGA